MIVGLISGFFGFVSLAFIIASGAQYLLFDRKIIRQSWPISSLIGDYHNLGDKTYRGIGSKITYLTDMVYILVELTVDKESEIISDQVYMEQGHYLKIKDSYRDQSWPVIWYSHRPNNKRLMASSSFSTPITLWPFYLVGAIFFGLIGLVILVTLY